MNENSLNNLITFDKMDKEKQIEIAKKGKIASDEAKQKNALFRDIIKECMAKPIDEVINSEKNKRYKEKYGENVAINYGLVKAQIEKGLAGDTRAFESLRDTLGEKPTEKVEIQTIDNEAYNKVEQWVKSRVGRELAEKNVENDTK